MNKETVSLQNKTGDDKIEEKISEVCRKAETNFRLSVPSCAVFLRLFAYC
jgi:hypothetical protein